MNIEHRQEKTYIFIVETTKKIDSKLCTLSLEELAQIFKRVNRSDLSIKWMTNKEEIKNYESFLPYNPYIIIDDDLVVGDDDLIAESARVSYDGDRIQSARKSSNPALVNYLVSHDHTSPLEQTFVRMTVQCPLFVARQWFRHRLFSYNEISGRYTQFEPNFYITKHNLIKDQSKTNKQGSGELLPLRDRLEIRAAMYDSMNRQFEEYQHLIDMGLSREAARSVLPLGTMTRFVVAGNLRSWLNFVLLRNSEHAQEEIRELAACIHYYLKMRFTNTVMAFESAFMDSLNLTPNEFRIIAGDYSMRDFEKNEENERAGRFPGEFKRLKRKIDSSSKESMLYRLSEKFED